MSHKEKTGLFLEQFPFVTRHWHMQWQTKSWCILFTLASIILLPGCSTRKNTSVTRGYHELTTRYNIYFNAEESYNEILKDRSENMYDDYVELLPFYPTISETEKRTPSGPFDLVIEKTEKAIREHSIAAKPRRDPAKAQSQEYRQWLRQEEFNPFLKNVWLLRGKAYLQNGDYNEALSVFSGMLRLFGNDSHLVDETELWMLRTYTEMGRMFEAEKTVYAFQHKQLPEQLQKLHDDHYTYFLIRRKEFTKAIPHLRKAVAQETDYLRKKRLQFLLGQLYATTGEQKMAYQAFEKVKGLRTPFELTLNATLWQSTLSNGQQQRKIMQQLKKMEQKVNDADSTTFLNRRYRIYLKAGNDSLVHAFRPSIPDTGIEMEATVMRAAADSTGAPTLSRQGTPQRLSEGRTPAENAALHRQWKLRNGLWQREPHNSMDSTEEKVKTIPFSINKNGPHYLLLTFTPGSADRNQLIFAIANFNFSHFKLRRFNSSYTSISATEAVQIDPFYSYEEASRYTEIMHSDTVFLTSLPQGITPVVISEENLELLRSGKNMDEYNVFYAENIGLLQTVFKTAERDEPTKEIEEKKEQKPEKIVSLEKSSATMPPQREITVAPKEVSRAEEETSAETAPLQKSERETPEALKRRLEENAAKALQQQQETASQKERKQSVKERERERQERIRQREKELKERQRQRDAELKQRERERARKVKEGK